MVGKAAQSVVSGILAAVKKLGLKFEDCRAISFDNASVMVGAGPSRAGGQWCPVPNLKSVPPISRLAPCCCIHKIQYFYKVAPPSGFCPLRLVFGTLAAISWRRAWVGAKTGVQKRLCELNEKLAFINCDNHSLNVSGVHTVKCDTSSVTFFNKLNALIEFFSRSTQRWNALKKLTAVLSVKGGTDTRWSSREEAVCAVVLELDAIFATMEELSTSTDFTADTRSEAETLLNAMLTFEFLAYFHFWNAVLRKINVQRCSSTALVIIHHLH